jgi:hypothetical protein
MKFVFTEAALRSQARLENEGQLDSFNDAVNDAVSSAGAANSTSKKPPHCASLEGPCPLAIVVFREPDDPATSGEAVDDAGGQERSMLMRFVASTATWVARNMQSEPRMIHCELMLVNQTGDVYHHATYIGQNAAWQIPDRDYYGLSGWRALVVPTTTPLQVDAIGQACSQCNGAPYSLSRYLASSPIGGLIAKWLPDEPKSPAHCSGLVARILHTTVRGLINKPSPRYSPSLLYARLCEFGGPLPSCGIPHSETIRALLYDSDDEIRKVPHIERARALYAYASETLCKYQLKPDEILGDDIYSHDSIDRQRETARLAFRVSAARASDIADTTSNTSAANTVTDVQDQADVSERESDNGGPEVGEVTHDAVHAV